MSDIIYEDESDSQGQNVVSTPNGLIISYFADSGCINGETTISWDKIIAALPIRAVKENEKLFKNIVCVGCKDAGVK